MNNKKRKSLDDALAHEFVYGESAITESLSVKPIVNSEIQNDQLEQTEIQDDTQMESDIKLQVTPKSSPAKLNIISQLKTTTRKEATIRLTVDLSESMHHKLSLLAVKTGRKKVEIVRFLLDQALKDFEE